MKKRLRRGHGHFPLARSLKLKKGDPLECSHRALSVENVDGKRGADRGGEDVGERIGCMVRMRLYASLMQGMREHRLHCAQKIKALLCTYGRGCQGRRRMPQNTCAVSVRGCRRVSASFTASVVSTASRGSAVLMVNVCIRLLLNLHLHRLLFRSGDCRHGYHKHAVLVLGLRL